MNNNKLSIFAKKSTGNGLTDVEKKEFKTQELLLSFIENGRTFEDGENNINLPNGTHCIGWRVCTAGSTGETSCYKYRNCNNLFDRHVCNGHTA